ncbi:MAG: large conductance mechanosensitive channel protein MscL [Clostridia bacterium]|nr:large conductance mechanosensitive channel protein MscL [Clostridia bacterium]
MSDKNEKKAAKAELKAAKAALKKQTGSFFQNFKKFISKGNVVDLAVGVIIGASFGKIVTSLVNDILNPFLGLFLSAGKLDDVKTVLKPATEEAAEVAILWGNWVQTIIDFLITAFCIFLFVQIITKAQNLLEAKKIAEEKAKAKEAEEKAKAEKQAAADNEKAFKDSIMTQEKLLAEIRDLLKDRQ